MTDFFVSLLTLTSKTTEIKKDAIILGYVTGLKLQLALLEAGAKNPTGGLVTFLRGLKGQPIFMVAARVSEFLPYSDQSDPGLDEEMFSEWVEMSKGDCFDIYTANIGTGALYLSRIYKETQALGQYSEENALAEVKEIVEKVLVPYLEAKRKR